jgi:hypothetical protein
MTSEQRTFLEARDIVALEFECGHCQARHVIPVDRFDRAIYECPNCKEELLTKTVRETGKTGDDILLRNFVTALNALRSGALSVKLRLEVKGE